MLRYLLQNSELSGILKFVSPNFIKVVDPLALMGLANRIRKNHADSRLWASVLAERGLSLERGASSVRLTDFSQPSRLESGHPVLALFFEQIYREKTWILDLRAESFASSAEAKPLWNPSAFYLEMEPLFLEGIRGLYRGFYQQDEPLFESSLSMLGLLPAREALRAHFGQGDQTRVEFHLKTFQATFTEVFAACAESKTQLHIDFFALGLCLLTLYEHLEGLGGQQDVRGAFLASQSP